MPFLFGKNIAIERNKIFRILFVFVSVFFFLFFFSSSRAFAASRYWVGGTGNWDTTDTTHWSATSGGAGGATVPGSSIDVVFDENSGSGTATITGGTVFAKTITQTNGAGTLNISILQSNTLNLYGNVVLLPGKFSVSSSTYQFRYFGSGTLVSGGNTLGEFLVQGASVAVVLGDALIASKVTLTSGTLTTGAFTHSWGILSSSNSNTRVFNGTGSTVNITGTTGTVLDLSTSTGLTFTAPTTISLSSATATRSFNAGGNTFNNVNVASSSSQSQFTGDITVNGVFTISSPNIIKITGGKTIAMGPSSGMVWNGSVGNLIDINVLSGTTPWIISRPSGTQTFNANYLNLGYSTATQANTFFTSNTTNTGTNTNWVFANAPDAPTGLTGTYGDAQASLSWTLGADNGASITDHVVEYKLSSNPTWSIFSDGVSALTTATVTGLTNGASYDFRVSAVNATGQGSASTTFTLFVGSVKYARAVGGNWSANATWSTTSGGSADTTAPTATDYIIFDTNSGNVTVDTTTAVAKNLNMTGSAGTLTITNAMKLSVSGSVILASGKFTAGGDTAELAMLATGTLITNGNILGALTFNGGGQTFTLGDANTTRTNSLVTLTQGILVTGSFIHNFGLFNSSNTNTRTLDITNSTINMTGSSATVWLMVTINNMNFISTGSTLNFTGNNITFFGGGKSFNNVIFPTTGAITIRDSNIFVNLSRVNSGTDSTEVLTLWANQIVTGILTLNGGADNRYRLLVKSDTLGIRRTITLNSGATTSMQRVDFRDIGFIDPIDLSGITGGAGDALGNNNITFTTAQPQWFKHTSGAVNWSDSTKWYQDQAKTILGRVPLPQDDVTFDANSFSGTSTLSVNVPRIGRSLDMSAVDDVVTMTVLNEVESYGSHILGNNITPSGLYSRALLGRSSFNFNSYNKSIHSIKVNAFGGTYTNQSNLTLTNAFAATTGTFDFNDYDSSSFAVQISNTAEVILYLGNGTHSLSRESSGNVWQVYPANILYSEGSTIKLIPTVASSSNLTFYGSGKVYNKVWFSGTHTGNFDVVGGNSISELIIESGRKVRFTSNTTQQIGKLTALGTALNPITISSITGATHTLNYTGTGNAIGDYLNLSYSTATPANKWFVSNSTNGGNNTGWTFANVPDAPTGLTPTAGSGQVSLSWTAGADNGTAITDYIVEYKLTSEPTTWSIFSDGVSALTTSTVTGLTNGQSYDFRVSAVNAVGQGTASATATSTSINPLDRYWVGGTGNWSDTTHWSNTSNGAGGQTVPTSSNDVYFDLNSGAGNATVDTTTAVAKSVNMTGSTTTLTITNAMKLSVSGNVTLASGKFTAGGDTAELVMLATGTLVTAGNTMGALTFNGSGQTFTLGDATTTRAGSTVTLTQGTLITGALTHSFGIFMSNNSNLRTVNSALKCNSQIS